MSLKLEKIKSYLPQYLDTIKNQDTSLIDSLYELTTKAMAHLYTMFMRIAT
ncbi:hypothetical protein PRVXT_000638 [Proteinivorax tanatarense]|uniref:Uncharacterized protein n=1 Tax=Proteinivorax tanatarense TaxID=1260629 RepID=A0AAU7VN71_9FIRM